MCNLSCEYSFYLYLNIEIYFAPKIIEADKHEPGKYENEINEHNPNEIPGDVDLVILYTINYFPGQVEDGVLVGLN